MDLRQQATIQGVPKQRVTSWHNPTADMQRVVIAETNEQRFMFEVPPGETRELDSRYDRAIQMVDCGHDECHKKGWFCHAGHDGMVVGGNAPLLKRVGKKDSMEPTLDPTHTQRKEAEKRVAEEVERQKVMADAYTRQQAELEAATKPDKTAAVAQQAKK